MRFILLLALVHIYLQSTTCNGVENDIGIEMPPIEFKASNGVTKGRTSFLDLDWDVYHLIIRDLTTYELISLADVHESLQFVVGDVLRRRFATNEVIFSCPYYSREPKDREFFQNEHDRATTFMHLPMIRRVLKHFGHLIARLNIYHQCETDSIKEVYRLVHSQCSDSLFEFGSASQFNDHFDEFKTPLINVSRVSLDGDFNSLNNTFLTFSELFPQLRTLIVDPYRSSNAHTIGIFDDVMPSLEHLSADCSLDNASPSIKKIVRTHPRIRSVFLEQADADLLQFVAETLPHLEDVELKLYSEVTRDSFQFNFARLKRFVMKGFAHNFPQNIMFRELEEFEMNGSSSYGKRIVELALQSKKSLRKLRLNADVQTDDMLALLTADLDLVEFKFDCGEELNFDHVIELIRNNKNLKSVEIVFGRDRQANKNLAFEMFQEQLSNEWNMSKIDYFVNLDRKPTIDSTEF